MDLRKAEQAALELLRKYHVASPPVPVDLIAEDEGLRIAYHDLEDHVSGLLIRQNDQSVVAINIKHHHNRQRFSIAHELGHFMLHSANPTVYVDDLLVHFRADKGDDSFDPRESEANAFAAALLMPFDFLKRDLLNKPIDVGDDQTVRLFARRYSVSPQALTIRLVKLGLVHS